MTPRSSLPQNCVLALLVACAPERLPSAETPPPKTSAIELIEAQHLVPAASEPTRWLPSLGEAKSPDGIAVDRSWVSEHATAGLVFEGLPACEVSEQWQFANNKTWHRYIARYTGISQTRLRDHLSDAMKKLGVTHHAHLGGVLEEGTGGAPRLAVGTYYDDIVVIWESDGTEREAEVLRDARRILGAHGLLDSFHAAVMGKITSASLNENAEAAIVDVSYDTPAPHPRIESWLHQHAFVKRQNDPPPAGWDPATWGTWDKKTSTWKYMVSHSGAGADIFARQPLKAPRSECIWSRQVGTSRADPG